MVKKAKNTSDANYMFGSSIETMPHPYDPRLKVTNDLDTFERLTQDENRDGVILALPEDIRKRLHVKVMDVFHSVVRQHYGENRTQPVMLHSTINVRRGTPPIRQISSELQDLNGDLTAMFESFARTTSDKFMFLATDDTRFLAHGSQGEGRNKSPILIAHWTVAGNGHLNKEDQKILKDGDWGYFQPGAHLPLHPWHPKHTTFSVVLIPTTEREAPEANGWR